MRTVLVALGLGLLTTNTEAIVVYSNDFEVAVGSGLSTSGPGLDVDTTPTGRNFLGSLDGSSSLGLSNETVTLTLMGLTAHSDVTVTFKLFTIQSWDGNGTTFGPDIWQAGHSGSLTNLQNTTFGVAGGPQCFPSDCPASNPLGTGADEPANSLGYPFFGDRVYDLSYTFGHTASTLVLQFTASNLQPIADESWGIDNLIVDVTPAAAVPEPATVLLLSFGLVGLAARRMRSHGGEHH